MGLRLLARAVVLSVCAAGCALIAGLEDEKGAPEAGTENQIPPRREAGSPDAPDAPDAGPCTAKVAPLEGKTLNAKRADVAPEIDGVFADWACVDRVDMGRGDYTKGLDAGGPQAVEFGFVWTPTALYFHARATTTEPGIDHTDDQFYRNDSVHLILGPAPVGSNGQYRQVDYQFVFDHKGNAGAYRGGSLLRQVVLDAKVTRVSGGPGLRFDVEARFPPSYFGLAQFEKGNVFALNLQSFDPSSTTSSAYRVWRLETCSCQNCCTNDPKGSPTCDMRCTETLRLE